MHEIILSLIVLISAEYGVPENFVKAIVKTESNYVCEAIGYNRNGTIDFGLMQLNSSWYNDENWKDPEANLRAGIKHIKWLMGKHKGTSWWALAVSYNAGYSWLVNNHAPPMASLDYADKVMMEWEELEKCRPIIVQ